jgi:hypothetical protein
MPLLPNGKLNRKALPHHDVDLGAATEYVAPTSRIETVIQAAWEVGTSCMLQIEFSPVAC